VIEFYTWPTSNNLKISIMLEETGLPYEVRPVDIDNGAQFAAAYRSICANSKVPAIVDRIDGQRVSVFESGAILVYLAEKTGQFLAPEGVERAKAFEWLFWQVSGIGPTLGQFNYFANRAPQKLPLALSRFSAEFVRLFDVLETRLQQVAYVAGERYTIADMAIFPWARLGRPYLEQLAGADRVGSGWPSVDAYLKVLGMREAVKRADSVRPHGAGTGD
jgi:GSH-dependent disulfide-bond oxidoreductase